MCNQKTLDSRCIGNFLKKLATLLAIKDAFLQESLVTLPSQTEHASTLKGLLGPILLFYFWSGRYCEATAVITNNKLFKVSY